MAQSVIEASGFRMMRLVPESAVVFAESSDVVS